MNSICDFSTANYRKYKIRDIEIFEHKLLGVKCEIKPLIEKWMNNINDDDISGVDRIYITRKQDIEASGTYTPVLSIVSIHWSNTYRPNSITFKLLSLLTEKVFYHEIGHHVHRHRFGYDTEQEKEADRYAYKILKRIYPKLHNLLRILSVFGFKSQKNYSKPGMC